MTTTDTTTFLTEDPRIGSADIDTWRAVPAPSNPGATRGGAWCIVAGDYPEEPDVWIEVQAAEYPKDIAEFIVTAVRNEHARQTNKASTCLNCRGTFEPDESSSQDPERFCGSDCESNYWGG